MKSTFSNKTYLKIPEPEVIPWTKRLSRALKGSMLSPVYWLMARHSRVPGLPFHAYCSLFGMKMLVLHKKTIDYQTLYQLIFSPMDSTRYFEFDFIWKALEEQPIERYLDISSPRLFPLILMSRKRNCISDIMNPDRNDLSVTRKLVHAAGLDHRCTLHDDLVESSPFEPDTFDVITSISVIEHIPEDTIALRKMWSILKPKGRMFLSVPCSPVRSEQFVDKDIFGLSDPGEDGYFFWQRIYDPQSLENNVYSVTGIPARHMVFGEKIPGSFRRNADRKRSDPFYPFWREPYMVGQEYDFFDSVDELPGEGVIAMEFVKP